MKDKAVDNLASSQILLNNRHYTTSVHCSYYAVFEYMKYILANVSHNPISYEIQNLHSGESSHEYILDEIKNRISTSPRNLRNFCEGVRFLKSERVDADYKLRIFTESEGLSCKSKAEGLIANLKTYFGNI